MTTGDASLPLVDPAFLARLEKLDVVAKKVLSGEFRGDVRTRRRGAGALFSDHKRYTQGDDLRFLDWNAYSRLGELLVKEFEAEENLDLLLVLDRSASMDYGRENKLAFAKRVAAALAYIALNRAAKVSLALMPSSREGPRKRTWFGRNQVMPLFTALDGVAAGSEADLFEEARAVARTRRARGLAIVISDFFSESGYARGFQFLRHAGHRVAALHVLDRLDLHPEAEGRVELIDMETGRSLERTVSREIREAFEREVRGFCEGVERFCRANDVAYVRLDTTFSLERVVTSLLLRSGVVR